MTKEKERRDMFTAAALKGLCSTEMVAQALADPAGPSKLGMAAMMIADATIAMLDKVDPPKRVGEVICDEQ